MLIRTDSTMVMLSFEGFCEFDSISAFIKCDVIGFFSFLSSGVEDSEGFRNKTSKDIKEINVWNSPIKDFIESFETSYLESIVLAASMRVLFFLSATPFCSGIDIKEKNNNKDKTRQNRAREGKECEKTSPMVLSNFIGPARNPFYGLGQPKLAQA
ncbi:hypothetical protein Tco_1200332 [Tanacetum coccineum]